MCNIYIKKIVLRAQIFIINEQKYFTNHCNILWFSGKDDYKASTKRYPVRDIISLHASKIVFLTIIIRTRLRL